VGNLIGGVIGGVGSLLGGNKAKSDALTGYNYLTGANGTSSIVNSGTSANTAEANLLGLNGPAGSAAAAPAFNNYLNSTGYNFQLGQGQKAITGSAAAKGLLNSGDTAKALTTFGQNSASTAFDNYLNTLGGVTNQGLTASGQIGTAGTQGGQVAANAQQSGITKAGGIFGDLAATAIGA
jgi:hypothetical protein